MHELPWLLGLLIDLGDYDYSHGKPVNTCYSALPSTGVQAPYPNTPESPEPLPVSMVTQGEFRFLQVSGQVMPWSMHIKSVSWIEFVGCSYQHRFQ